MSLPNHIIMSSHNHMAMDPKITWGTLSQKKKLKTSLCDMVVQWSTTEYFMKLNPWRLVIYIHLCIFDDYMHSRCNSHVIPELSKMCKSGNAGQRSQADANHKHLCLQTKMWNLIAQLILAGSDKWDSACSQVSHILSILEDFLWTKMSFTSPHSNPKLNLLH